MNAINLDAFKFINIKKGDPNLGRLFVLYRDGE